MPALPKPGKLNDPEIAALFSTEDPERIFSDLREIGHGSFGAVYYARNVVTKEIVAIKKMSYNGKQAGEKWQDIIKEVKFLRQVKHENTIDYKGCFLKEHTAWMVMEYCLGSASDIIEVHKKPLKEDEIGEICHQCLKGLEYLHSFGKIHRDVKAGNILLTENGTVKLADFGSASIVCPANSFVGTPYWMAPEVILAMDEGQYEGNADIWSLGITCIELAERKPPLFNMNAMSALYHIAQNDPPTLAGGDWSDEFRQFVDSCLSKSPCDRPSANILIKGPFIDKTRPPNVILDLILRTKDAVRELDNLQYRRMKKILMVDVIDGENGPNGRSDVTEDDSSQDGDNVDSSKSSSIASQQSSHSISMSSKSSSQNSIHSATNDDLVGFSSFSRERSFQSTAGRPKSSNASNKSLEPGANNFATIRTTSIVTKQIKDHEVSNELREQFAGYKRLRKQHQKQLLSLESKYKQEMEEHKQRLDKEYDNLKQQFGMELERLKKKQQQDLDKRQKTNQAMEKKLIRQISVTQDTERKTFGAMQKKEYKLNKEQMKREIDSGTPKKEREDTLKLHKDRLMSRQKEAETRLEKQHKDSIEFEIRKFRRRKVVQYHTLEKDQIQEELTKLQEQQEKEHSMLLRHHESTQELEYKQLLAIQNLRDEHLRKQHITERENQKEYNSREESNLRKKHLMEHKQQPRSLKQKEVLIRKQFHEAVQTQRKQYRALKDHIVQNTPKNEQKAVVKKLKEEQVRKLNILGEQYEASIAEMLQQQNMRLDDAQLTEAQELKQRLQQELELLMAYQSKIKMQMEAQHHRERKQLEERVSLRRALLEQKMDDDRTKLSSAKTEMVKALNERQMKEIDEFDEETISLGMNAMEVLEASTMAQNYDDDVSLRGSMISLTPSNSSSSFTSTSYRD
ncbi:serine/threonine-protein kinase TAO1-like isoform X3 [Mytilus trossulus]|uniref:serine/threonine-protein kinase TAO1-like isoform X3 n=1 Tax=Mytilus trossulus TaxID=6551 RepID=UPI00300667C2